MNYSPPAAYWRTLDVAAGYVMAQKAEAIVILIDTAAAFIADQAAAVATFGIAEAAAPLIIAGAEKLVQSLAAGELHLRGLALAGHRQGGESVAQGLVRRAAKSATLPRGERVDAFARPLKSAVRLDGVPQPTRRGAVNPVTRGRFRARATWCNVDSGGTRNGVAAIGDMGHADLNASEVDEVASEKR